MCIRDRDKPNLSRYMKTKISKEPINGVIGDFGFGELEGTGRVDTQKLLKGTKNIY